MRGAGTVPTVGRGRSRLAWKPDGTAIWEDQWKDQIEKFRDHGGELNDVLTKVEKRGGPAAPWTVDLARRKATPGPIELSFHVLPTKIPRHAGTGGGMVGMT